MALFDCLTANDHRQQTSGMANQVESLVSKIKHRSTILATKPDVDLVALGLTESEVSNMRSMQANLDALVVWYEANGGHPATGFIKRHAQVHIVP